MENHENVVLVTEESRTSNDQSEYWELDETAFRIVDVPEWTLSLYDMKRYAESLSLITKKLAICYKL